MTKLLFDLQISSFATDGTPKVRSDSNFLFTQAIIKGLKAAMPGFECAIMLDGNWPWNIAKELPHVNHFFTCQYGGTEQSRYFVDLDVAKNIKRYQPDIIWTNDPCRVGAYRAVFQGPIVAYNHWIDNPLDAKMGPKNTYFFRQLEAYFKADLLLFNSNFGIKFFLDGIKEAVGSSPTWMERHYHAARLGFVNPPQSTDLLLKASKRATFSDVPTIAFNHRLSSAPQYNTNAVHLERLMDHLDENDFKYLVLVSNPSGKAHDLTNRKNVVNIHNDNYEEYVDSLSRAWYQVNFFEYPGQWSMAMAEALCLGTTVIYPRESGAYSEVARRWGFGCDPNSFIDTEFVAREIMRRPSAVRNTTQAEETCIRLSPRNIVQDQLMPLLAEFL